MRIPSQRRKATWRQPVNKVRYTFPISGATEEHVFTGCRPLQPELCSEMDLAVLENASLVGLEQVQARPARLVAGSSQACGSQLLRWRSSVWLRV